MDDEENYIDFNNQHWHLCIQVNFINEFSKKTSETFTDIIESGYLPIEY
jgi:hypothetical protein